MSDKTKFHLTVKTETAEWLEKEYPDADSLPEAARAAIGDARRFWRMADVEFKTEGQPEKGAGDAGDRDGGVDEEAADDEAADE